MKNIRFYIALFTGVALLSCESSETTVDQVFDETTRGAVLRTISIPNSTFDFFDTSSVWTVELEEQDAEDGGLFQEIRLFVRYVNSSTGETEPEVPLKTIPASQFSTGPFGLPRGTVSATLDEVLTATGLGPGDYVSSDQFLIRLVIVLTDGREFSNEASGGVTGGSFFSSPFLYSVQFFCPLADASLFDGNYVVVTDAWADYSAGDIVPVIPDPVDPFSFRILSTNNAFISNPGTSYMLVTIDPSDGSVTVSSNECFDYGPGFCADVTGSGSVGTCTGDINIVIDFGGFTGNAFSLVQQ